VPTNIMLNWFRTAANRAVSMAGYRKARTQHGLAFYPKDAWGFDPWEDLAKIYRAKNGAVTVLDVGANAGQSVVSVTRCFPSAKVLSFEPDPRIFSALEEVSRRFPGCTAFPFALGAEETHLQLLCTQASEWNSFLAVDGAIPREIAGDWNSAVEALHVPVRRLDAVCNELALSSVDILKIDVQGYESSVLEGAGSMLTPVGIRSVLLEICLVPIYEHQATADQLFALFAARGYSLVSLYPSARLVDGRMTWCDALFSSPA
jgi:FkbM family methyltransferase